MRVFITKYALSSGIDEANDLGGYSKETVRYRMMNSQHDQYAYGEGKDWHKTWESAKLRAEEMRTKKIASLKKQINLLEKLTFTKEEK